MSINPNVGINLDNNGVLMFGIFKQNRDGEKYFIPKGEAVMLNTIVINFETNEQFYLLSYSRNGRDMKLLFPCEKLTKAGVLTLAKNGVDVTENNATVLLDCLQKQRYELVHSENFTQCYTHKHLGWYAGKKFDVFRSDFLISLHYVDSAYQGDYDIQPKGSFEAWTDMVKNHVIGNTNLELALIIGLSACVNGYIGKVLGCENLLVHLMGESTTGKTTASMLALSTAGYPDQNSVNKESLFRTWHSTKNAMFQPLIGNNGYPVLFDEFSMNKDYSITDVVYAFANGKDKDKLTKECEQRITDTFQTTIISTGEESLFNKCSKNTGLLVRIIEFVNFQWTTSAEQSNAIKQGVRENYGWAINIVASMIRRFRIEQVKERFNECKEKFIDGLNATNEFTDHISTKYAIITDLTVLS